MVHSALSQDTSTASDNAFSLYGETFNSRFLLGTALYPSPQVMRESILRAECDIVTFQGGVRILPGEPIGDSLTESRRDDVAGR